MIHGEEIGKCGSSIRNPEMELNRSSAQSDEGERTGLGVLLASSLSVSSALTSCAGDVCVGVRENGNRYIAGTQTGSICTYVRQ